MIPTGVHRVFVDANIWYSKCLRDWLGLLYTNRIEQPFQVFWSEDVLAEALRALRRNHPTWDGHRTRRVHDLITQTFEVGRVDDYSIGGDYRGADPDDHHVHAAAMACSADLLLTLNISHFPAGAPYEVISPDAFFLLIDDQFPHVVRWAVQDQTTYWYGRDRDVHLSAALRKAQCPAFAERVRQHLQRLPDPMV